MKGLFKGMRLFILFFLFSFNYNIFGKHPVYEACVMDYASGRILYAYNAGIQTQPASLTKMMTLFLTFKALQKKRITMKSKVIMSRNAANQKPCKLGIRPGTNITVRDAILSLITKSANDVAVALGELIGGDEKTFVYMMNREARRLGLRSTVFMNPSGWKNPKQLTTARDMACLSRALIKQYSMYYHLFSTKYHNVMGLNLHNHNHLLGMHDDICVDGIKTGYVTASGYNLAASAIKNNRRLIVVVLGGRSAKERDVQVKLLLRKGFARLECLSFRATKSSERIYKITSYKQANNIRSNNDSERILKDYQLYKYNNMKKFMGDNNGKINTVK